MKSLNLLGKTYGGWTVLREGTYISTHKRWWCRCNCGKELQVLQTSLVKGASHSCGCWKTRTGKENLNWNGYEEIAGSHWASIRNNAKTRKIEFNISLKDGWELFLRQNRRCAMTNIELTFSKSYNRKLALDEHDKTTASLDRIDSSVGYIKENVQWVHKDINMMKRKMTDRDFIHWCKLVTQHRNTDVCK